MKVKYEGQGRPCLIVLCKAGNTQRVQNDVHITMCCILDYMKVRPRCKELYVPTKAFGITFKKGSNLVSYLKSKTKTNVETIKKLKITLQKQNATEDCSR